MFDDFDTQIQSDELAAINALYWYENELDWMALGRDYQEESYEEED